MEPLPPSTDGDEVEEAAGERGLRCAGERWCATGLIDAGDESIDRSIGPVVPIKPENRSSRLVSWDVFDVGQVESAFMSKLNGEYALELEPDADGVELLSAVRLSKVEAKDMNMGLLAIVVYGALEARPVLAPNPKSICMAPSVAVG